MLGMTGYNVENVKLIGRRDINMDANMKRLFDESDEYYDYPYFNDAKELLRIGFGFIRGERLIINRKKYEWETLNTPKIKTIFYSILWADTDFGTRLRFKCNQRMTRKAKTIEGELCTNWDLINSFGVRLDLNDSIHHTDDYKKFYNDLDVSWKDSGEELL